MTTTRLEELRALKEQIKGTARPEGRSRGRGLAEEPEDDEADYVLPSKKKTKRGGKRSCKSKGKKPQFKEWFLQVADMVEEVTGMELDILPDFPWSSMFRKDMTVDEAVQHALRIAEEEGDDEAFEDISFRDWLSAVNDLLEEAEAPSIDDMRGAGSVSHSTLHMTYMKHKNPLSAAEEILSGGKRKRTRRKPQAEDRSWIKRLSHVGEGDEGGGLTRLMNSLGVDGKNLPKVSGIGDVEGDLAGEAAAPAYEERLPVRPKTGAQILDETLGMTPMKEPPLDQDIFASAMAGVRADSQAAQKVEQKVEEAAVIGGDYGRWGPATSAASSVGRGIAKALGKDGVTYKFSSDGMPQSEDGGTVLWFNFAPSKKGEDNYWLGFKISGSKEDPTWAIKVKKGKGLAAASTVASKSGVKTGDLKSAASGIKGDLGSK